MTAAELINWTWQAIASGMAGNAAYDGIKALLGNSFNRLEQHYTQQERTEFEQTLEILLENNRQLRQDLTALAQGKNSRNISHIHMDDLNGDNNFNQGNITITKG
ncbi:MAG: hypothetical protein Q4E77_01290 [Conchiformibius sp.]|nr:hypothetical protein [Conchiformibius sp.]